MRDSPPDDSCPVAPPTFRPRREALPSLAVLAACPPPPPDDPELKRLSMNGDASAFDANPRTTHARITKKVRARAGLLSVRFAFTICSHPAFFAATETTPWHAECNSGARAPSIALFSSRWLANTAGLWVDSACGVRRRERMRAERRSA